MKSIKAFRNTAAGKMALTVLFALQLSAVVTAQSNPKVTLQQLSYVYIGDGAYDKLKAYTGFFQSYVSSLPLRIVYALNEPMAGMMRESLLNEIVKHWSCETADVRLDISRANPAFREFPKFKPKVPKGAGGQQSLFVRVVDIGATDKKGFIEHGLVYYSTETAAKLLLECKVLEGEKGTEIFSRSMEVILRHSIHPVGEYPLYHLPGLPASFLAVFGTVASRFFAPDAPPNLTLDVATPCLYLHDASPKQVKIPVSFRVRDLDGSVSGGASVSWTSTKPAISKAGVERDGGGAVSGILTMALGSSHDKSVTRHFVGRKEYLLSGKADTLAISLPFSVTETQTRERVKERRSDGSTLTSVQTTEQQSTGRQFGGTGYIKLGETTLGSFVFSNNISDFVPAEATHVWDGTDTATLIPLLKFWRNNAVGSMQSIRGNLLGKQFAMHNGVHDGMLEIHYDHKHIATIKIESYMPTDGLLYYADLAPETMEVLAILATVPFSFF